MRIHFWTAAASLCAVLGLAKPVAAGCPAHQDIARRCDGTEASVESCALAIRFRLDHPPAPTRPAGTAASGPRDTAVDIVALTGRIEFYAYTDRLISAADQNRFTPYSTLCKNWFDQEWCEVALIGAVQSIAVLDRPEVAKALPPDTRARILQGLRADEAHAVSLLEIEAARNYGDATILCNETYASVTGCRRAVDADSAAIRKQTYPLIRCGQFIWGEFVTAGNSETRPSSPDGWMLMSNAFTFADAQKLYADRLRLEKQLLAKAQQ